MATNIYIVKRPMKGKRRNGQHKYKLALRWKDPTTGKFCCEAAGTADRTEAESLRKLKWAEVNGLLAPPEQEPEPPALLPTWQDCRDAFERAMRADNLRPSYVASAREAFNVLERTFPGCESPALVTHAMANDYKRQRADLNMSPWSIRSDLSTLRAVFGKWLGRECGLLAENPFANVKPPKCDDPEVRIVSAAESEELFAWLNDRWNNWRLPSVYLEVAMRVGWRATEIASLREEDLLADGYVRVIPDTSKTRKHKFGRLPDDLHAELRACAAGGFAFGRFSDELRRLLILWKKEPNHAARVKDFAPKRLVAWLQSELERFNAEKAAACEAAEMEWHPFTLHDFRRTAITGLQMAGMTEKEVSVMVGATPEVIRRHYENLDGRAIAKRCLDALTFARPLRAGQNSALDGAQESTQTLTA